ncbi:MAG TPA: AsmA-like C-terminal region-containing protein, partial [Rhizomicrobium sp.]
DVMLHVSLVKGVLTIKPMTLNFIQGKMSGSLTIDGSRDVPVTSTDMRVTNIRLENFIGKSDKPITGLLEARAVLVGHGHSVHEAAATSNGTFTVVVPGGTMRRSLAEWMGVDVLSGLGLTLAGDKSATHLRCAVGHFDVQNGVMTARQFVLDTGPVLVKGQGSVDLGKETVDLRFAGQPKSFQLIRLRAPVTVTGPLGHPAIGVKTDTALAQGGIGLLLGVLAPPAALLAFVDPGMASNADCASLLAGTEKKGALPAKKPFVASLKPRK